MTDYSLADEAKATAVGLKQLNVVESLFFAVNDLFSQFIAR
jgi:hypothetical protein